METLGPLVRQTRERKGIRASDLAYLIGKDPSYLSKLERDLIKDMPTPEVIVSLAKALDIPEVRLLRALGFMADTPEPRPTYGDNRLQVIVTEWGEFTEAEKNGMMLIVNLNRYRRGLGEYDDIVQIVTEVTQPPRRSFG